MFITAAGQRGLAYDMKTTNTESEQERQTREPWSAGIALVPDLAWQYQVSSP